MRGAATSPALPSAACGWGHLGSCARRVGNNQGASGVPGGVSLHLAGQGCCGCCPCSEHTGCRAPCRGGGSRGTPPAPSTKCPILGAPTLAPGKGPAMASGSHSASPHPKPWKNKASAPTLLGVGKASICVYGEVGGGGGVDIKPHLPWSSCSPLAACSSLPTLQQYLSPPGGRAAVWAGWRGCCCCWELLCCWVSSCPGHVWGVGQMPCPHHGVLPVCPLAWALWWAWAAGGSLTWPP